MRFGLWNAGLAALLCAAGAVACAQQGKPATTPTTPTTATTAGNSSEPADIPTSGSAGTINVQAKLVVMPAVVRDKKGALVTDLKKENFSLEVDGQAQAIRYFDHDTDVPLTLGLLVDVSGSMRNEVDPEKSASQSFLDTMMMPAAGNRGSDKAFVVQFAKQVELLGHAADASLAAAAAGAGHVGQAFITRTTHRDRIPTKRAVTSGAAGRRYDAIYLSPTEWWQAGREAAGAGGVDGWCGP